jgi:hypothetical protein
MYPRSTYTSHPSLARGRPKGRLTTLRVVDRHRRVVERRANSLKAFAGFAVALVFLDLKNAEIHDAELLQEVVTDASRAERELARSVCRL